MNRIAKKLIYGMLVLSAFCMLSACGNKRTGWFRDRSEDYVVEAVPAPALTIPKGLNTESLSEEYRVRD